jgi:WD40 repeat protein
MCVCAHTHTHTQTRVCMYVYIYIHIYIHTNIRNIQVTRELWLDGIVTSLQMDPQGQIGVASTVSGTVWQISSETTPSTRIGGGHAARVTGLAYCDHGDVIASCAADGTVAVWAVAGMEMLKSFHPADCECRCVAFGKSCMFLSAFYGRFLLCLSSIHRFGLIFVLKTCMHNKDIRSCAPPI